MKVNNLFILFLFVPILALVLLALTLLLAPSRPDEAKSGPYECGFSPVYGQTRTNFSIHFYIVAMLFLIFDLEIVLLFPISLTLLQVGLFGFAIAVVFFLILKSETHRLLKVGNEPRLTKTNLLVMISFDNVLY